jgi:hypothetical protein
MLGFAALTPTYDTVADNALRVHLARVGWGERSEPPTPVDNDYNGNFRTAFFPSQPLAASSTVWNIFLNTSELSHSSM